jgi:membrane associated rhomboid family serine protease
MIYLVFLIQNILLLSCLLMVANAQVAYGMALVALVGSVLASLILLRQLKGLSVFCRASCQWSDASTIDLCSRPGR